MSIFDDVVARESDSITVTVTGDWADVVPVDDTNLAIQAARALAKHAGVGYGADLVIHKAIPVAGGMAGGSADAAAALVACNELWGLGLPAEDLMRIAADLGSDVPFSLMGGTALGTGRGELLTELPTTGTFHWTFAMADGGLSTPSVYAECDRLRAAASTGVPSPDEASTGMHFGRPLQRCPLVRRRLHWHALGRCLRRCFLGRCFLGRWCHVRRVHSRWGLLG